MTATFRTAMIFAAGMIAALALMIAGHASAGQPVQNIPLHCTEHIDHEGNASVGHCHSTHPLLSWQHRACRGEGMTNCFDADGGDGGKHPSYRRTQGDLFCVYFTGSHRYANSHDYCIQN